MARNNNNQGATRNPDVVWSWDPASVVEGVKFNEARPHVHSCLI